MRFDETYKGLRVLDLATNIAGPFSAMILGDMGADVIKVERSPAGDDTRGLPPTHDGTATVFLAVNRNKRSLLLDLRDPADRALLLDLAANADVVVESFPPGVGEKLGFTYEAFRSRNPDIILCSVSAFGDGPVGSRMPGYDALVQAVSGLMSFTGSAGDPTVRIAPSVLDLGTGMWAAMGMMAALARRAAGGGGEHVRPALIDTAFNLMNHQLLGYLATGNEPEKLGSGAPSAAPYGVFRASDGELMIATASEPQFPRLCAALGLPPLGEEARFATIPDRIANRTDLDALIAARIAGRSVAEWLDILGEAGISCGRVNSVGEAIALPEVSERGLFVDLPGETGTAPLSQLRLPIDRAGAGVRAAPPALGAHSDAIRAALGAAKDWPAAG
ncbi:MULTISPECIES: CaiB/BaiF CoA transferase family protein [Sphingopyxis]|jgi:crotonobetainyl-CoA:carnitine CoA-transferase CaiB-like acyl-CoA transferase|uniref:L-carnitine dehydratase/bile acid-inducible protein F n=1 Tax=Sphingopyxis granuli TaxID=267128 RepID=A0AA86GS11_9SPHN|nr:MULTISPECIES: CoA transferase [Sphingopyxis]AMG75602.1 L-carnitine dehydratase/bile acid-inducible protein F [Sphingopyxis granuli]HEV7312515.1 CoA transferase [Sphingopyxis sp.]